MMKLTTFLLCASFIQVTASVYSQSARVTFSVKESSLERVLELIERQSDYSFIYNHEQLKDVAPLTVDFYNSEIRAVLSHGVLGTGV